MKPVIIILILKNNESQIDRYHNSIDLLRNYQQNASFNQTDSSMESQQNVSY